MGEITSKTLLNLYSNDRSVMESAFNCIYKEYSSLVYYVAFDILHVREDAEDVLNETFVKFYSNRGKIESVKSIKYLLLTMTKNLSINKLKTRELSCDYIEEIEDTNASSDQFSSFIDEFKEFLDKDEIDIVVFHLLYGFSFREIAKEKKVTTSVISSKYRRIIVKLRAHYKE